MGEESEPPQDPARFTQRVAGMCRQLESLAVISDREAVLGLLAQLDETFAEAATALGAEFLAHTRPQDKTPLERADRGLPH